MEYLPLDRSHLEGVVALCRAERWPSFSEAGRTLKALTAPGVTSIVAVENGRVVGFAYVQSDGVVQAHLSLICVDRSKRRAGIARNLLTEAFRRCGASRIDLVSAEGAEGFYRSFPHRQSPGFRIYPLKGN